MGYWLVTIFIGLIIGGVFYLVSMFSSFFIIEAIYQLLDNVIFLAFLMGILMVIYSSFYLDNSRLTKKQAQRAYQAAAIAAANRNRGFISAASFALESNLRISLCDRLLKEMERRKIFRTSSEPGKMAVYEMDHHVYVHMPYETDDNEEYVEEGATEQEKKQRKRRKRTRTKVIVIVVCTLLFISEEQIMANPKEYFSAAFTSLLFLLAFGHYIRSTYKKEKQRSVEHDVLTYVMNNIGELNPKEIPYYTSESYESIEPIVDSWYRNNYCSTGYEEDGGIIYVFPNYTEGSKLYEYDDEDDPFVTLIQKRSNLLLYGCLAFVFTFIGGYVLVHWSNFIFTLACIIFGGIYGYKAMDRKKAEAEKIERIGLQLATKKGGAVAVYELAYNARITMDEAAKVLGLWEQSELARKVYSEDGVPTYVVSGLLSKEQRLQSEHV